jgi:hypothetical protein
MEIRFLPEKEKFKMKITLERHGPRLIPNHCHLLDPSNFLLTSTFNKTVIFIKDNYEERNVGVTINLYFICSKYVNNLRSFKTLKTSMKFTTKQSTKIMFDV